MRGRRGVAAGLPAGLVHATCRGDDDHNIVLDVHHLPGEGARGGDFDGFLRSEAPAQIRTTPGALP